MWSNATAGEPSNRHAEAAMEPLHAWLRAQHIWYDPRLEIVRIHDDKDTDGSSPPGTLAMMARTCILPGALVARIPCSSLLCSPYSALNQLPLFKKATSTCKPSLCLALCVLYEQSLACLSAFDVYFRYCSPVSLPSTDKTWDNDPYFAYTEAWYRMKRRAHAYQECLDYPGTCLKELHDFWHTYGEPVLGKMLDVTPTLDQFLLAFSCVSSRAFVIDVFHGLCLVPVADLFNHSAPNNVQVESDSDVCIQCGSVEHSHCSSPLPDGATGHVDIRCTDTIEEDDEAMNSYGDLGNAELVCQYGFSLPFKTGWDRCSWDVRMPCERRQLASLLRVPESLLCEDLSRLEPGIMSEFQRQHIEDGIPPSYQEQGAVYDMAPLTHPHDHICPLFVDGYGRASWPLWRLCLFSGTQVFHVDDILHEPKLPAWEHGWALTHKPSVDAHVAAACAALERLCEDRIQRLYIHSHEQEAMEELEGLAHHVRRSTVYHALQDMDMLRACCSRYGPCPD